MDRETFLKVTGVKASIGIPFTLEQVAETMKCKHFAEPPCSCKAQPVPSSWMMALITAGRVVKIADVPSSKASAKGRKIALYVGSEHASHYQAA